MMGILEEGQRQVDLINSTAFRKCNDNSYRPEWCCNRQEGHPGQHCFQRYAYDGYNNVWWASAPEDPLTTAGGN